MVKIILISLLLLNNVLADIDDPSCEKSPLTAELEVLAESFQIPNCNRRKYLDPAKKGDFSKLCGDCVTKLENALKKNPEVVQSKSNIDLNSVVLNEFKKGLSENLLDIAKLRSVYSIKGDFSKALTSCDLDSFEKKLKTKGCSKNISFKDLKNQLAEELGTLLSNPPLKNNKALLIRNNFSCNISDTSILRASALSLENALTPEILEALSKLDISNETEFSIALESLSKDYPLSSAIEYHPIFSRLKNPLSRFRDFFKSLPKPASVEHLRAALYTDDANNKQLTDDIARRCSDSFKAFEEMVCDKSIKSGKIRIDSLKDASPYLKLEKIATSEFIDPKSAMDIEDNQKLASLCRLKSDDPEALNLKAQLDMMNGWMPANYSSMPFEDYRKSKYEHEIDNTRNSLCAIKNGKQDCDPKQYHCQLYKLIESQSNKETPEGRLALSSDKEVNKLLRSFIGTPTDISEAARTTLINEGILPKNPQGEFVAQPDVPERRPEFVEKQAELAKSHSSSKGANAAPAMAHSPKTYKGHSAAAPASFPSEGKSTQGAHSGKDAQAPAHSADASQPDMSAYNEEILRRLSQSKATKDAASLSKDEVKKIARQVYKEAGKPLTSAQENLVADQFLASHGGTGGAFPAADPKGEKATLTPGDDPKEQWAKEQKLRALSGMYGAQAAAGRGPASEGAAEGEEQDKKLSTVAVKIAEDKVKVNLSDILSEKILKDDLEGKLLKVFIDSKKDFILQVNDVSFKVSFNKKSGKFAVSFDSGDKKVADKIRPQLEKFFKKASASSKVAVSS